MVKLGILKEFDGLHQSYEDACRALGIEFEVIDIISDDWFENVTASSCPAILCRPSARRSEAKTMYDERLYFIDRYTDKMLYPSFREILIYENKRAQHYWLKINKISMPKTWIFYDAGEALDFLRGHDGFPLVFKTNLGSAASGFKLLKSRKSAVRLTKRIFTRTGLFFKGYVKWGKGPLGLRYPILDDIQFNNVLYQEHVDIKTEWRGVRIGESYFLHKKEPGISGLRSGSGLASYGPPPESALDFLKDVCDRGGFRSMNVDFFESVDGRYLVNELHTVFASKINEFQMMVNGLPGRYKYKQGGWIFEEGDFNRFESNELRVLDTLSLLEEDGRV